MEFSSLPRVGWVVTSIPGHQWGILICRSWDRSNAHAVGVFELHSRTASSAVECCQLMPHMLWHHRHFPIGRIDSPIEGGNAVDKRQVGMQYDNNLSQRSASFISRWNDFDYAVMHPTSPLPLAWKGRSRVPWICNLRHTSNRSQPLNAAAWSENRRHNVESPNCPRSSSLHRQLLPFVIVQHKLITQEWLVGWPMCDSEGQSIRSRLIDKPQESA